jgi:hypothetical protein
MQITHIPTNGPRFNHHHLFCIWAQPVHNMSEQAQLTQVLRDVEGDGEQERGEAANDQFIRSVA